MGWCSGTDIFDAVMEELEIGTLSDVDKLRILKALIKALGDKDWDCESDSYFYNYPLVKKAFKQVYPKLDWD